MLLDSIESTGKSNLYDSIPQYLYLLSDEEIKEGELNTPSDFWDFSITNEEDLEIVNNKLNGYRKVIASTDPSLNLPKFPYSFLEEYVNKYNSKKSLEVEVKYIMEHNLRTRNKEEEFKEIPIINDNTISIRFKEEKPCTHKVVEEAMRIVSKDVRTPNISKKEEKMYSRSNVEELLLAFNEDKPGVYDCSNWIKENLK
jgi:hypothetical protein